ncbi:MAG: RNA polymerase sigma factor RpoH [Alphaproteobacteria bacterium]|jgi:RNA polymerase sigma-32 factor|nr:RNA polymerase sigma factor RpoH [Alphaproteobacteria bacterium]
MSTSTDLDRYLAETRSYPMLTAEEERDLARRWRDSGDEEAARKLVGSHMRLVVKIARKFSGYGVDLADVIAEGNVGLMQAVEKFDPELGYRFATYAQWWIRAAIQEYVLTARSLVRMGTTSAQKKLFFNLRRLKSRLAEYGEGDLSPDSVSSIARDLGVPEADVIDMNRRLAMRDASLNAEISESAETEWQDLLEDEGERQDVRVAEADELGWRRELLEEGLQHLDQRERHILVERRLSEEPMTLEALGRHYGVSSERVRQIEVRAFEKLQKAVRSAALNSGGELRAA